MLDTRMNMELPGDNATSLPDIQKTPDQRNIAIDKVGVRKVKFPIVVLDRANERQHTIGDFTLTVDLPSEFKGTHMSRFLEVLNDTGKEISVQALPTMLNPCANALKPKKLTLSSNSPSLWRKKPPSPANPE
jgi:GTP cyclohydrolase IB